MRWSHGAGDPRRRVDVGGRRDVLNPVNACASGGGLYAGLNGASDHAVGTYIAGTSPRRPNTRIASYRIWRAADVDTNRRNETPIYTMNRQANIYDGAHVVEQCPAYGCASLGSTARPLRGAEPGHRGKPRQRPRRVAERVVRRCRGLDVPGRRGSSRTPSNFRMYRGAFVLQDDSDPVFTSPPAGSLTRRRHAGGSHGVSFSATDAGGGLYEAIIEVDGNEVAAQSLGCSVPFTATVPCKLTAGGTVVARHGGAGGRAALCPRPAPRRHPIERGRVRPVHDHDVERADGVRGDRLAGAEGHDQAARHDLLWRARERAGNPRRRRRGHRRCGSSAGSLARARRRASIRTPVTTDAGGASRTRSQRGPSRTLHFGIRGGGDPQYQCSGAVAVRVRARGRLTARPAVVRAGRSAAAQRPCCAAATSPRRGKLVELQAFDDGRWRSVRTVRTNARGAFRYTLPLLARGRSQALPVPGRACGPSRATRSRSERRRGSKFACAEHAP